MGHKLALSYGHGSNTYEDKHSKGVAVGGNVYEEHTFNAAVGEKVRKIVEAHGVDVLVVQPPMGKDVALKTRTDRANAWGADLYWSIHANAGDRSTKGIAGFYWSTSKESKKLADIFANHLKEAGMHLYSGGTYASVKGTWNDFHELRETNMPAILTENGFMTNPDDFKLIFQNAGDFHTKLARIHAKTILEYFGIKYDSVKSGEKAPVKKEEPKKAVDTGKVHRVQVGAFSDKANADKLAAELKKKGYSTTIV